ncbi:MAG: HlyD family efflux transporter periplasmic adaptor subunit [Bacteroidia bacterium]|nr:HlyD family efflux transporter periplasmic adaptor subunit [Bacteroidia bacterium]
MKSFRKLILLLAPLRDDIKRIYFLAIAQALFYISVPLGIQAIVTYTMAGKISASLILLGSLTIIAVIFIGLFQLWQMRVNETVQQKLLAYFGIRFSEKITRLHPNLYLTSYLPGKINHFFDVLTLQKGLSKILLDVSFSIISIVFGLLILSAYTSFFMIFTLATALAFYYIIRVYGNRSIETSWNESTKKYLFVDWLQKLFRGLKNNDPQFTNDFIIEHTNESLLEYITDKNKHFQNLDIQYRSILGFKVFFTAVTLFLGIWLVQTGYLNIGQFVASEILVILIINSVEKLVISLKTVYDVLTATEKLHMVLELENESNPVMENRFKNTLEQISQRIYSHTYSTNTKRLIYSFCAIILITLFMPWNQTVYSEGVVSNLNPANKPQVISSRISGRIERWYVSEGQSIKKNDTIAFISEVKEEYIDPQLVSRTQSQVNAKESSIYSYENKINSINTQIDAINAALLLKLEQGRIKLQQARVKVHADSAEFAAVAANYKITEDQFKRYEGLLAEGVISKTDLENRKAKVQESLSKRTITENKFINSKNELVNIAIELNSIKQEYNEKLMKAESEKFSSLSALYDAEAELSKMQNKLSNYGIRNSFYYLTAPQDGYITKSYVQGVGDIVKDGAPLVSFVPNSDDLSIELYIEPMDLPLVHKNMNIQLTFDGWPAFVFSGWPGVSFGTYQAKVVAIDQGISENGKFRILAQRDKQEWPFSIRMGSGVKGFVLLNKVPVIYELWRKINGFPPEFYQQDANKNKNEKDTK